MHIKRIGSQHTCQLPMNVDDTELVIAYTSSGAEALAKKVRKGDVVSAFSSVPSDRW